MKNIKTCFLNFYKDIIKTWIKNIKLRMFPIATFSPLYTQKYLTLIIKNKNLPFVKTKNRNVLMYWMYRSKQLNAIRSWKINHICNFVRLYFNKNKKHNIKTPDADRVVRLHSDNFYKKFPITFGIWYITLSCDTELFDYPRQAKTLSLVFIRRS